MDKRLIRLAYAIEFPIALIALFTLWSQAAGQGHLDLIYWYWKLAIGLAAAFACVKATQAALAGERAWNGRTAGWLSLVAALMLAAGLVTYYGHLYYEDQDAGDEEEPALTMAGGYALSEYSCALSSIKSPSPSPTTAGEELPAAEKQPGEAPRSARDRSPLPGHSRNPHDTPAQP